MHGLADWWERHPGTPRRVLTETLMAVCWRGIAAQAGNGARAGMDPDRRG
jgi:hypothetical protein